MLEPSQEVSVGAAMASHCLFCLFIHSFIPFYPFVSRYPLEGEVDSWVSLVQ